MGIFSTSGATISVTSNTTAPATFDAAGYGALSFTQINSVEDLGEFGDESSEITADDVGNRRTKKLKGQRNAGTKSLVCFIDDTDSGQGILRTAEADDSTGDYYFKVTYPNKQASGGDDAIRYFGAKVMSARETLGSANNVAKITFNLGINTDIVEVGSTAS